MSRSTRNRSSRAVRPTVTIGRFCRNSSGRMFAPRLLRAPVVRALRALRPERILDLLLRIGPYRLSLAKLRQTPHGVDLGPLEPGRIARSIATADGRIDIAPADFVREARDRLLVDADGGTSGDLLLIGRRQLRSNNSWLHNSHRLVKGRPQCTLLDPSRRRGDAGSCKRGSRLCRVEGGRR